MQGIYETVYTALQKAIGENVQTIVEFLPNLISAVIILLIGWIIAKVAEKLVAKILQTAKVDEIAEKRGISHMLKDVGIDRKPSIITSRILYWLLMVLFLVPILNTLGLESVSEIMRNFLAYIPNIIAAILIFIIGLTVARILAGSIAASAKGAGLEYASAIGIFVKYFITLVVLILGLAQIGIETNILTIVFAVLIVSFGLAVALSLGLGSRAVVSNILAGAFAREHFPAGKEINVRGMKGKVIAIGSVTTSIETEEREITVPNTLLIENVIE